MMPPTYMSLKPLLEDCELGELEDGLLELELFLLLLEELLLLLLLDLLELLEFELLEFELLDEDELLLSGTEPLDTVAVPVDPFRA